MEEGEVIVGAGAGAGAAASPTAVVGVGAAVEASLLFAGEIACTALFPYDWCSC